MARVLRNIATYAETLLWGYLKTKPFGFKFRRQHPCSIHILDFDCPSRQIIIEVDGSIHDIPEVTLNDEQRQSLLEKDGLIVLRFTNDQIEKNFDEAKKEVEISLLKYKDDKKR